MKWVSVNNGNSGDHYELWDNDNKLVDLSLSSHTKIARIVSSSDKRLFFIEKRGFLHAKTVIKNEYGIKLGELNSESWDEGMIDLDGTKYSFAFPHNEDDKLVIYNETKTQPLVSCSLSGLFTHIPAVLERSRSLHDTKYPSILMALCWYLLKLSVNNTLKETAA
jgi:hypothetical protein